MSSTLMTISQEPSRQNAAGLMEEYMSIVIEENIVFEEVDVKGNHRCPGCGRNLILTQLRDENGSHSFGYCITCDRYFQAKYKCDECSATYACGEVHVCGQREKS